jgi:hypothetical protein
MLMSKKLNIAPDTGASLFTRGTSDLNEITIAVTTSPGESPTLATHQGKFYDKESVVEATSAGVVRTNWKQYKQIMASYNPPIEWCIMTRIPPWTDEEKIRIQGYLREMLGPPNWKYSNVELLWCYLDEKLGRLLMRKKAPILFRRIDLFRHRVICPKASNRVDVKMKDLPKESYYWNPDDTWDFMVQSQNWKLLDHSADWMVPRLRVTT